MSLREKQSLFVFLLAKLVRFIESNGWELTLGEGFRSDLKGHMPGSLHYVKLAQDLNLFVGGKYIEGEHPAWPVIGSFWKSLHPLCAWGGDFVSRDFNHFSLAHEGKR